MPAWGDESVFAACDESTEVDVDHFVYGVVGRLLDGVFEEASCAVDDTVDGADSLEELLYSISVSDIEGVWDGKAREWYGGGFFFCEEVAYCFSYAPCTADDKVSFSFEGCGGRC